MREKFFICSMELKVIMLKVWELKHGGGRKIESYNANFLGGSMGGRKIEIYNAKFLGGSMGEDKLRFIMLNFWVEAWGEEKLKNL